ncbi:MULTISPECIES: 2-hydroxyacid dehydrogenase [Pasteurellaceae]|uniref:2-hydroxyacid dehydrogenase n=1 Tax=Pasteurella atlantica TaxID=2827233 RepID=A0AAW8CR79_9PAST|nr:2-hydroxyacid dehydrogenase [Pasteurella atlantica]MBR0574017.1 2-hydroxyacid dehydrogenase [Pasteurella atlantica]MDP8039979.1 2-hydroxyacid dehydrogenase [Pasteurella atlantica]MDP8042093.1 2-hydroxyacid dehydrogenase [Pasteurella atlantica]MDP8044271.1 2-hydroxyacid dehydrogenase [Pasteurella atlantica]MDP8046292.1 2-hydroxyacid dehydrogenase [Pasteurella atlantica]
MLNIVFLESTAIPSTHSIPRPQFPHNWIEYSHTSADELYERAKDADIVIMSKIIFNREIMSKLPKLKLIAVTATGTNNIDLVAAKELGIEVKNVTGYSSVTVPEHVLGMIFSLKHQLISYHKDQVLTDRWATCGQFYYADFPISDIRGSTIGIFGKGCLGTEVGRLAELLGMKVLYAEHKGAAKIRKGYTPFETVLKESDIITLHCPLTETTQNLINAKTLALMKPNAILINTGRGPLVDEIALLDALENGTIAGAGIDVMIQEPPQIDNPLMQAAKHLPNLLITPHVAWASQSATTTLCNKVAQNIEDFVKTL